MKWTVKAKKDKKKWHRWFAWYPVRLQHTDMKVFGEWVLRKHEFVSDHKDYYTWRYRDIAYSKEIEGTATDSHDII